MLGLREHFSDGFVGRSGAPGAQRSQTRIGGCGNRLQTSALGLWTTKVDVTDVGGLRGDGRPNEVELWC